MKSSLSPPMQLMNKFHRIMNMKHMKHILISILILHTLQKLIPMNHFPLTLSQICNKISYDSSISCNNFGNKIMYLCHLYMYIQIMYSLLYRQLTLKTSQTSTNPKPFKMKRIRTSNHQCSICYEKIKKSEKLIYCRFKSPYPPLQAYFPSEMFKEMDLKKSKLPTLQELYRVMVGKCKEKFKKEHNHSLCFDQMIVFDIMILTDLLR